MEYSNFLDLVKSRRSIRRFRPDPIPDEYLEKIKQILGVPEEFEFYEMMPVGYPGYKPRPKLLRPWDKMVHYDRFIKDDIRTDAEVDDFARKTWTWTTANHRRGLDK